MLRQSSRAVIAASVAPGAVGGASTPTGVVEPASGYLVQIRPEIAR